MPKAREKNCRDKSGKGNSFSALQTADANGTHPRESNNVNMVSQKCEQNYIKHPQNIPIWVTTLTATNDRPTVASLKKAQKYGGLVFRHTKPLTPGTHVEITIRITQPVFRAKGIVSWCRARKGKWEIAAQFINTSDAFRIRMIEQVCHIEQYKRDVAREEGRYLSTEKAAHEWIKKYASQFPNPFAPFYTYK